MTDEITLETVYKKYRELLDLHEELECEVLGIIERNRKYYQSHRPDLDLEILSSDFFIKHKRGKRISSEKTLLEGQYNLTKMYKMFSKREELLLSHGDRVLRVKEGRSRCMGLLINALREFYNDVWIDICRVSSKGDRL